MAIELVKRTIRVGNSAGVLLPKSLLGAEVKITVIKRVVNHKKIALKLLSQYLEETEAACITNISPLEVIAISSGMKKILKNSNLRVTFVPKNLFIEDFNSSSILRKKIINSIPLINKDFFKKIIRKN